MEATAEVLDVRAEGHVRISDGTTDKRIFDEQQFCLKQGGCACPGEAASSNLPALMRHAAVAATGGPTATTLVLIGQSAEDACCSNPVQATTAGGLGFQPVVDCQRVGLFITRNSSLKLNIGYALYLDRPRLVPHVNKKGKLTGVDLEGIKGFVLDFGAGAANGLSDNRKFKVDVPIDVRIPVESSAPGLPRSLKVHWTVIVNTAIAGNNSTLLARGKYGLAGPIRCEYGGTAPHRHRPSKRASPTASAASPSRPAVSPSRLRPSSPRAQEPRTR